jgi:hypothetical protein
MSGGGFGEVLDAGGSSWVQCTVSVVLEQDQLAFSSETWETLVIFSQFRDVEKTFTFGWRHGPRVTELAP